MIRPSFTALVALASFAVACSVPSGDRSDLASTSSAIETGPVIDYPLDAIPPGEVYPTWGSCYDGSRAPRAFVRYKRYEHTEPVCPDIIGREGTWVGHPLDAADWYCSYEWKDPSYSEYGWLALASRFSPVHRSEYESLHLPTDLERPDIRPDCMKMPSPCIRRDGLGACLKIAAPKPERISEEKGMSPCGACGEALSERHMLVVLPHWFSEIGSGGSPRDLKVMLNRATGMGWIVHQPEQEQVFVIEVPGGGLNTGMQYDITR